MCGRFSLTTNLVELQEQFNFEMMGEITPRFNIAPSQNILVIGSNGHKRMGTFMKWGLVPPWSHDIKTGYKMINAKAETLDVRASFKDAFQSKRCLILSDGFYEWKKNVNGKEPYRIVMKDRKPFAMAGLWERWTNEGKTLFTCTIITTTPNKMAEKVHNRMPVILREDLYDTWINREITDTEYLKSLLTPYPEEEMELYPVSPLVNSTKNDRPECLEKINFTS